MNIDELKKAIETDTKDVDIALKLDVKKSSQSSLNTIRKRLIIETWCFLLLLLPFIDIVFLRDMHQSAQGLVYYTSFICAFITLGAVIFQTKLIKNLTITDQSSKKFLEKGIILIRSYVDYSKFVMGGASIAFFITLYIPRYGNSTLDEQAVTRFLYFHEFTYQHTQAIGLVLISALLAYTFSSWYYNKYYMHEVKKLEKIINDF